MTDGRARAEPTLMPVVDVHAYDLPISAPESFIAFMDRELGPSYGSFEKLAERYHSTESYLGVLDEAGVDYAVVLAELAPVTSAIASNETVERLWQGSPRLIPFASVNPYLVEHPGRVLDRLVREHGFRGVKLYPTYQYILGLAERGLAERELPERGRAG